MNNHANARTARARLESALLISPFHVTTRRMDLFGTSPQILILLQPHCLPQPILFHSNQAQNSSTPQRQACPDAGFHTNFNLNVHHRTRRDACRSRFPMPRHQLTEHGFQWKPLTSNRLTMTKAGLLISSRESSSKMCRRTTNQGAPQTSSCEITCTIAAVPFKSSIDSSIFQPTPRAHVQTQCRRR